MPVKLIEGTQTKVDYTPSGAKTAGLVVSTHGTLCILSTNLDDGELGALNLPSGTAIYRCPKEAGGGVTFADGADVGFDISADTAVAAGGATSDGTIGTCVGGGADGDAYVDVWHVAQSFSVSGVAEGYRVARGETALDGSNPTPITTGLTTIVSFVATLKGSGAPGVGTSTLTYTTSGGTASVYAWKPTSNADPTLVASTGTETVGWIAVGT